MMKHGQFPLFIISLVTSFSLNIQAQNWSSEVDEFLDDPNVIQDYKNLEGLENKNYEIIDGIAKQKEKIKKRLNWKEPPKRKPRIFTETEPYTAQLKKGSILKNEKTGKYVKVFRDVIVKARETYIGSREAFVLDKDGNEKYTTQTHNVVNVEHEVAMTPKIDPLIVYRDKDHYHSENKNLNFNTYVGFHVESISTSYYADIYRGERQSAQNYTLEAKTYFLAEKIPYNIGLNLQYQYGYWQDETIGTVTWSGVHIGPSFMASFWEKKNGRWNAHLNLFKSLFHESEKSPDIHKFSTIGTQIEFEKEIFSSYGKYSIGIKYTWMKSTIKESSEYLENVANRGVISSFGGYITYNFGWDL